MQGSQQKTCGGMGRERTEGKKRLGLGGDKEGIRKRKKERKERVRRSGIKGGKECGQEIMK